VNIARPYNFTDGDLPNRLLLACTLAWTLATACLLELGVYGFYQNHLFDVGVEHTRGTVQEKTDQGWVSRYGNAHHNRYLAYSYVVAGVTYSSAEIPVTASTWFSVEIHGSIPIKYLADNPADSRIDYPGEDRFSRLAPAALLFLGVLFLIAGVSYLRDRRRRRQQPPHIR